MFKWAKSLPYSREIISPDTRTKCTFSLEKGTPYYQIIRDDAILIKKSRLGFLIHGEPTLGVNFELVRASTTTHAETISINLADTSTIDNTFTEAKFHLTESTPPRRHLIITFRVFNDSVAFRYELKPHDQVTHISIRDELTEFNLASTATTWSIPAYQPDRYEYNYDKLTLSKLDHPVHTPFTAEATSKYLAIHEAALYDYGAMNLVRVGAHLKADITPLSDGTKAHVKLPFTTPWRLIMLADSPLGLTTNHTMYALNPAPRQDFSWVKPLKFLGIWWAMYVGEYTWAPGLKHGASTAHALEYIDAAVKLGLSALLIEGWNDGWEGDWLTNGATTSFTRPMPDFDLERVAAYATARHIELIGHHETVGYVDNYESQLEKSYNFYLKHGIHYIKTGYSGSRMLIHGHTEYHHSQVGVRHYQKALTLAARKKICLDVHEPIKGTGIERTYPNLLTREGARGQEYEGGSLKPSHACILPFTRLLAGGMDYTPGIFDLDHPKKPVFTTITRQLAYYVTIFSSLQMAADRPALYEAHPDLYEFIRAVPPTFVKSVPLAGDIGKFYAVARQAKNGDWFIGAVTDCEARDLDLPLDFLDSGSKYRANIYEDASSADYRTNKFAYNISRRTVTQHHALKVHLAPGGGSAIKLTKIT